MERYIFLSLRAVVYDDPFFHFIISIAMKMKVKYLSLIAAAFLLASCGNNGGNESHDHEGHDHPEAQSHENDTAHGTDSAGAHDGHDH